MLTGACGQLGAMMVRIVTIATLYRCMHTCTFIVTPVIGKCAVLFQLAVHVFSFRFHCQSNNLSL